MKLTFKKTDSSDADLIALVRELDADLAVRDGDEHAFYAQYNKIDMLRQCIIAYAGEKAVGCGAFKSYDTSTAEIKRMYVPRDMRGRGIAAQILRELENWAAELGFTRCILETGIRQPEAIRLYQKENYLSIPNYGQYAGKQNSVCFEKNIT